MTTYQLLEWLTGRLAALPEWPRRRADQRRSEGMLSLDETDEQYERRRGGGV